MTCSVKKTDFLFLSFIYKHARDDDYINKYNTKEKEVIHCCFDSFFLLNKSREKRKRERIDRIGIVKKKEKKSDVMIGSIDKWIIS